MGNCLKVANKEEKETFAENVLFNNRLNMREIRYRHLSPKGYIYCVRDRGHGVLMLYFEFEVFTPRHIRLWPACRDGVYLYKKRNRPKIADRVTSITK